MCYVDYQTHSVVLLGWQLESRKWEKFKFVINWENRVAWEYKEMVKKITTPKQLNCRSVIYYRWPMHYQSVLLQITDSAFEEWLIHKLQYKYLIAPQKLSLYITDSIKDKASALWLMSREEIPLCAIQLLNFDHESEEKHSKSKSP